jgi:YVTN family beta-propeller protein
VTLRYLPGFKILSFTLTSLKGNPAYKVVYTHTYAGLRERFETMEIFSVIGNTEYEISYESTLDNYPKYFQTAQRMINSLDIYKQTRNIDMPALRISWNTLQGLTVNNNLLYVANSYSRSVLEIDASTDRVLANVSIGREPTGITVNPNTNLFYVVSPSPGTVSVIDGSTNKVVANNNLTGHKPITAVIDPFDNILFVANSGSGTVSAIDGVDDKVLANIRVG